MDRIELSCWVFRLSWTVTELPTSIRRQVAKVAGVAASTAGKALKKLGTIVRGCGCDDDDPECCARRQVTDPNFGDWCRCDCHDSNTIAAAAESSVEGAN